MKSAQSRINAFLDESDETRAVIKRFSDKTFKEKGSFSFAAGYFESVLADVIMQLPKAKREHYRNRFVRDSNV